MQVVRVFWHRNSQLESRFKSLAASLMFPYNEETVAFHGTLATNVPYIMSHGFKIGGRDIALACGQVHGQGVHACVCACVRACVYVCVNAGGFLPFASLC